MGPRRGVYVAPMRMYAARVCDVYIALLREVGSMAHREERETTSLDLEAGWASLTRPVASRLVTA